MKILLTYWHLRIIPFLDFNYWERVVPKCNPKYFELKLYGLTLSANFSFIVQLAYLFHVNCRKFQKSCSSRSEHARCSDVKFYHSLPPYFLGEKCILIHVNHSWYFTHYFKSLTLHDYYFLEIANRHFHKFQVSVYTVLYYR